MVSRLLFSILLLAALPVGAQSLFVPEGHTAPYLGAGWFTDGELHGAMAEVGVMLQGKADAGLQVTREDLGKRRALLRSKLDVLQRGGGFAKPTAGDDRVKLQARLAEIEEQLAAQGPADNVLEANLDMIAEVLNQAAQHLWLEEHVLNLDQFYVLHEEATPSIRQISCRDLHNSEGEQAMLQLVQLADN